MLSAHRVSRTRAGFTLVELLVSMTITLIMMGGVVTVFAMIGDSVSGSRSTIEMSERLRVARNRMQLDLEGATAKTLPPLRPEEDLGYLTLIEGSYFDAFFLLNTANTLIGDTDDILAMTTRSKGEAFSGRGGFDVVNNAQRTIQSQTAEVIWFTRADGPTIDPNFTDPTTTRPFQTRTLYRRVLLVKPSITVVNAGNPLPDNAVYDSDLNGSLNLYQFQQKYDLSAHWDNVNNRIALNTLGDLTKPENRFLRNYNSSGQYPFAPDQAIPSNGGVQPFSYPAAGSNLPNRVGEDLVLANVLGFDLKVFDPFAPIRVVTDAGGTSTAFAPGDTGAVVPAVANSASPLGQGCFVDLNYNGEGQNPSTSYFSGANYPKITTGFGPPYASFNFSIYDTWNLGYESNPPNPPFSGSPLPSVVNGIDDDADGVVDDPDEALCPSPYAVPLRGMQVKLRVYEIDSRQVRECTVQQDFLPE